MTENAKKLTFVLVVAVSLDGKITNGKKEGTEWTSKEDQKFFKSELDRADVVVLGRKTFEAIPRPLTPRNRIIFSQSPLVKGVSPSAETGVVYFKGSQTKLLTLLKKMKWNRVVVAGGASIYDWFLKNKLVDEIYLTLEPVVFGSGKPFLKKGNFGGNWTLVSVKKLNEKGTLLLHYKK